MRAIMSHDNELLTRLVNMPPDEYSNFRKFLGKRRDNMSREMLGSRTPHMLAAHSIHRGAGFQKAVKSALSIFNPIKVVQTVKQIKANLRRKGVLTGREELFARLSQDAYLDPGKRKGNAEGGLSGWVINKKFSNDKHVVYSQGGRRVMVYRGTASKGDILPDLSIVAGTSGNSEAFKEAQRRFLEAKAALGGEWDTAGHSLGGTKAMWVAQQNNINSWAYNPGFNSFSEDRIDTKYAKHNVFVVKGDPVSNSILSRTLKNFKVLDSVSNNPLKNHSIDNFITEGPLARAPRAKQVAPRDLTNVRPAFTQISARPANLPPPRGATPVRVG